MATIQCSHTWPDGSTLTVTVRSKARYPDALGDLRAEAKRMWCEALAELYHEPAIVDEA
jgi:hypothetical protein